MADFEPPETPEQPTEPAGERPDSTAPTRPDVGVPPTEPDAGASERPALPDRIRVHALAKLLGVTSKRVLAHLTEIGSEARSAQSSVDRDLAETVRERLGEPAPVANLAPEPASAAATTPETEPQAAETTPQDHPVEPGTAQSVSQNEPQLFVSAASEADPSATTVPAPSYEVQAPLFLPPAPAEPSRRRRKAESAEPVEQRRTEEAEPAPAEADTRSADTDDESGEGNQPRRRRRGRRGRGRGRGEQQGADNEIEDGEESAEQSGDRATEGESADAGEAAEPDAKQAASEEADESETGEDDTDGSSRRRRRRRRRKVGGEAAAETTTTEDDPPNTVVHEREPRSKGKQKDEVQGITGSTRLEAKRQRRRDGRDAGRRRPPILTESEFLARRESVDRVMVVREKNFDQAEGGRQAPVTQVAVLEDNILVEHFVTSTDSASMVGNVYRGRVQNVLPSMEAAFVDIGRGRNGVLYAGEVNWDAAGLGGKERKIEQALKPGDQVLVQVSKDPVGHKGARLTTQISLAGRFLVYVPSGSSTGISRKLPDTERKRLKEILRDIVPADAGVIIRTASEGVSAEELARDVERLQAQWRRIEEQANTDGKGNPQALYEEPDLLVKVIRDLFNEDFTKLIIEGETAWNTIEKYVRTVAPDMLPRVERYESNGTDVFAAHRIDEQLAKALERKVWLPSGGTLVIDRTEAMTVIDVNTGKFTGAGGNLEETVTRNNLEAAEEIVRQMRLRDIGGMIVVDFIDMVLESNRDLVLRRLTEALGRDRTRHQVSEVTSLGLVQMTRKKLGTGLVEAFSTTCEHCHGRGLVVHSYPVDAGGTDDRGGRGETPSRKRRGRDRSSDSGGNGHAADERPHEVDASVKRAHPVALAMAAHHAHDHDAAPTSENAEHAAATDTSAESAPPPAVDVAVTVSSGGESVDTNAAAPPAVDVAVSVAPGGESADTTGSDAAVAAEAAPEDQPVAADVATATPDPDTVAAAASEPTPERGVQAPESEPTAAPRRPARRRVSRAASAPASDSAGTVFVISATDAEQAGADTSEVAAALRSASTPAPRVPRRRRAAGRPAGPPVDEEA